MHRVDGHKTWITHDDLWDYYRFFKIKKEFKNALQEEVAREHEQNPPQMYLHQSYQDLREECLRRGIKFPLDDPVFRDYESRLIRQLQFSRGLELYHVATEDMCKDIRDGPEYHQQLLDMLQKAQSKSRCQQIFEDKLNQFLLCVPSEWLYTQAQCFKISVFTPLILVPQLLRAMTTATELDQIQASLFRNADVSDVNIMRLCLQYAPGDNLSAKISCLQNIDSGQDKKWLNMCITDIVGAAVIENLSRTCDGDMLASVFQEIQRTFCEKLVSVLPQFQTAYERTMVYCADLNRKLQEALPKAQYFHFSGIFKCSEDVKNLNLNAMYDEAMCKILLDKTQATNLGIFLNDSAILHQYSRMSGKDLEDWVQRVLSFSNTTTSNPEYLYPYPLLFSEQIKQFRLQQGIEKKQRRQKESSFANSAHLERRALSDVQKCVDYLVMKTEDPTREHQWELDRVGA
eukprot:COSAG01_NODE_691_length_14217_cov_7.862658_5_plen_459_part_00